MVSKGKDIAETAHSSSHASPKPGDPIFQSFTENIIDV